MEQGKDEGTLATRADAPRALGVAPGAPAETTAVLSLGSSASPTSLTTTTIGSPAEAMHVEEIRRMRVFLWFVAAMPTLGFVLALTMHGDQLAARLLMAASALCVAASIGLLLFIRDDTHYRPWLSTAIGHLAVVTLNSAVYFFGVNSAVVAVTPIGTYFFALGQSFRGALSIHLHATLGHAVLTILQLSGVIPEVGVLRAPELSTIENVGVLLAIQAIFTSGFVMARGLRRATEGTMKELDHAVRDNASREALLNEAKLELARALKVGGPGRFTSQVIGSYRLGMLIGRGGMGEVYEAVHVKTGDFAATKLLGADAIANPELVARFLRELEIAASLNVDNVVRVLEVSRSFDELPYLTMERLRGETLADALRLKPRMTPADAVELVRGVGRGIGAAHAAGIVHRDLKPRNIFGHTTDDKPPIWKILDFGVSKLADHNATLTHGNLVGTPGYMAPEQAKGEDVDRRADLYALGAIAYRVLTGRPPYAGRDVPAILRAVVYETPPRPSEIASLPEDFDAVLAIAMAKRESHRFASAEEMIAAFDAALAGTLSAELRRRADEILRIHPWGETGGGAGALGHASPQATSANGGRSVGTTSSNVAVIDVDAATVVPAASARTLTS